MPYEYNITERDAYLRVEVCGERSQGRVVQDSLSLWKEIAAICKKQNLNHILAIFRLSGKRPLMATFDIIEGVQSLVWDGLMIAYVDLNEESNQENAIAENSALMHGISFRTFETEDEAKQWLKAFAVCG
ncbi:MAG: hypothetical protein V7731_06980 [Amphritea sp.]